MGGGRVHGGQVQSSLSPLSSTAEGASSDPTLGAAAGESFPPSCPRLQGERLTAGDVGRGWERNAGRGLCPALGDNGRSMDCGGTSLRMK